MASADDAPEPDVTPTLEDVLEELAACQDRLAHMEQTLEARDLIGQAKGFLMADRGITADEAFDVLRRASQRLNIKLRDVAAMIVAGRTVG